MVWTSDSLTLLPLFQFNLIFAEHTPTMYFLTSATTWPNRHLLFLPISVHKHNKREYPYQRLHQQSPALSIAGSCH